MRAMSDQSGNAADGEWLDGWWRDALRVPSPNFSARPVDARVDTVVLHSISLPLEVSAHFVVRRDGAILQFVSIAERAWHAGRSHWGGRDALNDWSIGVELEGLEGDTFEPAQYAALERLLPAIDRQRAIRHVVGHEHVAPGRKIDPGPGFDWPGLAARLHWDSERIPPAKPHQG
jgi:AmpD protein